MYMMKYQKVINKLSFPFTFDGISMGMAKKRILFASTAPPPLSLSDYIADIDEKVGVVWRSFTRFSINNTYFFRWHFRIKGHDPIPRNVNKNVGVGFYALPEEGGRARRPWAPHFWPPNPIICKADLRTPHQRLRTPHSCSVPHTTGSEPHQKWLHRTF